jgi:CO dehydrogenase maturation factor
LLGELEDNDRLVLCDMEAGLGTVSRLNPDQLDLVIVIAEPSAKGVDVARRAAHIAASRARVLVIANRIREQGDLDAITAELGEHELVAVPAEPAIARADRDGLAPIDVAPEAPGVRAMVELSARILASDGRC